MRLMTLNKIVEKNRYISNICCIFVIEIENSQNHGTSYKRHS